MTYEEIYQLVDPILNRYNPLAGNMVEAIQDHFGYRGRIYYRGKWLHHEAIKDMIPGYGVPTTMKITFWGGPPGYRKFRDGNVHNWWVDTVYHEIATGDTHNKAHDYLCGVAQEIADREIVGVGP